MAIIFPNTCPQEATPGEKRIFEVLKRKLPENFLVWYEPAVDEDKKADFVIYGPDFGILVLEVKDWVIDNIVEADKNIFVIKKNQNTPEVNYKSPLLQSETYMYCLKERLSRKETLVNSSGEHKGKPMLPIGHGVVMTNITEQQAENKQLLSLLPSKQVIYKNDFSNWELIASDTLVKKLKKMFVNHQFSFSPLSDDQLETLKSLLWPTLRMPPKKLPPINKSDEQKEIDLSETIRQRYRIVKKLGSGSFGVTYLAEDSDMPGKANCVIKLFRPIISESGTYSKAKEGFQKEAKSLQELGDHQNIPRLHAFFEENNELFLVQEYVPGMTLAEKIRERNEKWSQLEVIDILIKILNPLKYVHEHQMIHRDIKPANLIISNDGNISLIDFGAVRAVIEEQVTGTIIGTRGYISPEQARGIITYSADIYSVGIVAIELLSGQSITNLIDPQSGEIKWIESCPNINKDLQQVISQMILMDPHKRYKNASEALSAVENLDLTEPPGSEVPTNTGDGTTKQPGPDPDQPPKPKPKKMWPIFAGLAGAGLLAIVAGITFPYLHKVKIQQESLTVGILWEPESYQPLAEYIEKNTVPSNFIDYLLGKKIRVIVNGDKSLSYSEARSRMKDKKWDIAFALSPINSIYARQQGYTYLGGMFPKSQAYQSGLFVKADSPIQSIDDINSDTIVALGNFNSASSFYMPIYDLYGKKISVTTGHRGQDIIKLVKSGKADVGAAAIGDSIRKDDSSLRIIQVSRDIPGSGVYLSPNFSPSEQKGLTKLLLNAPSSMKKEANYDDKPEPDYTEFEKIVDRVNDVLLCSDFSNNPVNLGCSVNTEIIEIEGKINGVSVKSEEVILKVQTQNKGIYSVVVPKSLLPEIFGSDKLTDIQRKVIQVKSVQGENSQQIVIRQVGQIKVINDKQVSSQGANDNASNSTANLVSATVAEIKDGDTITVDVQGQSQTIRFACIDTPEIAQVPWGTQSSERTNQLIPIGTNITYNLIDKDRYGRMVAEIYRNRELINLKLVQSGNAVVYHRYLDNCHDNKASYLATESMAKKQKIGFWSQDQVCLPWDFRKKRCI